MLDIDYHLKFSLSLIQQNCLKILKIETSCFLKHNLVFSLRLRAVAAYIYMYYLTRYSKGLPKTL